ncbi:MAG: hypothetical protein HWN51_01920, partial [Desulfobacterales bacterium]|nr:hypothetical protein [Desulfobacterales bacterium]
TQPGQPVETSEAGEPVSPERLSIEKLEIWRDPETFSVTFQFGLKNIHPEGKRIKGYTFIVLKPEEGSQEPLRSSPWTPLKDGKPTLFKRGQYFSIARFKFVRGIFPDMERIELFKTATVYVYSGTGSLLVEQVYDLDKIFRS